MFAIFSWVAAKIPGAPAKRPELGDQPVKTAPSAIVGLADASKALEIIEPGSSVSFMNVRNASRRLRRERP